MVVMLRPALLLRNRGWVFPIALAQLVLAANGFHELRTRRLYSAETKALAE